MPKYAVYMFCDVCSQPHPMGVAIEREGPPPANMTLGDAYSGGDFPSEVADFKNNTTICTNTGRPITQNDETTVFLVLNEDTENPQTGISRKHVGKKFYNQEVHIDYGAYENCYFENCTMVYSGGPYWMRDNTFVNHRLTMAGPSQNTIQFMAAMYADGKGREIIENLFQQIREGGLRSPQ